jgi:hypothetical protein
MNLVNATKLVAGYTVSTDKTGRESLVVVAKGTYGIPNRPDREPALLAEQIPLVTTDVFTGEPGFSAPLYEIDFAPPKGRCDVLLNGSCHAPGGRPAAYVEVAIELGSLKKSFNVVGPRTYKTGLLSYKVGDPQQFTVMPITYNNAYGGVDRTSSDPAKHQWYPLNHAGVGYHPKAKAKELLDKPLPNTEELDNPVRRSNGNYKPMAFGSIGRAWGQRTRWAGTYDQKWLDHQFPFLPEDFDTRYFQSAAEDQQIDYPRGGEEVVLKHLTPQGATTFRLPADLRLPMLFFSRDAGMTKVSAVVDTVILEPDKNRFMLVWRAALSLRRNIREVSQVMLHHSSRQVMREQTRQERTRGKLRFKSLADMVEWSSTAAKSRDSNRETR